MSDITGWLCPLCGNVNSPLLDQCPCRAEDKHSKSILDMVPVKMNEEAKELFTSKEKGLVTQSKEG